MNQNQNDRPKNIPESFISKDIQNVGKDIAKTTIVWTMAGVLTDLLRKGVALLSKQGKSSS